LSASARRLRPQTSSAARRDGRQSHPAPGIAPLHLVYRKDAQPLANGRPWRQASIRSAPTVPVDYLIVALSCGSRSEVLPAPALRRGAFSASSAIPAAPAWPATAPPVVAPDSRSLKGWFPSAHLP